jgi:hypothetical protein
MLKREETKVRLDRGVLPTVNCGFGESVKSDLGSVLLAMSHFGTSLVLMTYGAHYAHTISHRPTVTP